MSLNESGGARAGSRMLCRVSCATCELREAGDVSIGGAGGGSSGLSGRGVAKGGWRGLASRGEMRAHSHSGLLSCVKVLGDL